MQKFDGVDGQDGMNGSGSSLQIRVDILSEEVDNIDQYVCRCNSELRVDRQVSGHVLSIGSPGVLIRAKR